MDLVHLIDLRGVIVLHAEVSYLGLIALLHLFECCSRACWCKFVRLIMLLKDCISKGNVVGEPFFFLEAHLSEPSLWLEFNLVQDNLFALLLLQVDDLIDLFGLWIKLCSAFEHCYVGRRLWTKKLDPSGHGSPWRSVFWEISDSFDLCWHILFESFLDWVLNLLIYGSIFWFLYAD